MKLVRMIKYVWFSHPGLSVSDPSICQEFERNGQPLGYSLVGASDYLNLVTFQSEKPDCAKSAPLLVWQCDQARGGVVDHDKEWPSHESWSNHLDELCQSVEMENRSMSNGQSCNKSSAHGCHVSSSGYNVALTWHHVYSTNCDKIVEYLCWRCLPL